MAIAPQLPLAAGFVRLQSLNGLSVPLGSLVQDLPVVFPKMNCGLSACAMVYASRLARPAPAGGVSEDDLRVERVRDGVRVRDHVTAGARLDRRLPVPEQVVGDADPRIDIFPVGNVGDGGKAVRARVRTRRDALCVVAA